MRFQFLVCLLLGGLAYGQAAPPAPLHVQGSKIADTTAPAPADKTPELTVGPDDVVITLKNFCVDSAQQGDACKTTITRAQFDKLVDALQPGMSPAIRRNLATRYATMLRMSTQAEKLGLDKQPKYDEMMRYARMQILSQQLSITLQQDAGKISDSDVEDYYKKNELNYEQATFARIFIPRAKQIVNPPATPMSREKATTTPPPPPTEAQKKAAEQAMDKIAADVRERAAQGEDPDKLQKDAYVAAGLPGNAPNTKMEKVRRTTLPPNHQSIMDLKPGEVSQVISDPNSGHYVYKMISKDTLTIETLKPEIEKIISGQRYRDNMQGFQGNVDLNDAYFGPARTRPMPPRPTGAKPPSDQPADDPD
jgi:hypothetical protein